MIIISYFKVVEHLPESIMESGNYGDYLHQYLENFEQQLGEEYGLNNNSFQQVSSSAECDRDGKNAQMNEVKNRLRNLWGIKWHFKHEEVMGIYTMQKSEEIGENVKTDQNVRQNGGEIGHNDTHQVKTFFKIIKF